MTRSSRGLGLFPLRSLALFLLVAALCLLASCSRGEKTWMVIEHDGAPVGYQVVTVRPGDDSGKPVRKRQEIHIRSTLLGGNFDLDIWEEREVDPVTGRPLHVVGELVAGDMRLGAEVFVEGDSARHVPGNGGSPRTLPFGPEALIPDPLEFGFLLVDSMATPGDSLTLKVLDVPRGLMGRQVFRAAGIETLVVMDQEHVCRAFEVEIPALAVSSRLWIDASTGTMVRLRGVDGLTFTLADRGVTRRVERWNIDDQILAPVELVLEGEAFRDITRMEVRARVRSAGRRLTAGDLNVPGQRFEGTVENNLIDGVFTLQHPRYDGAGAAPFPPDYADRQELRRYLEPEPMIEADDPVLVAKARELTEGASDCWEAALRLSRWVSREIGSSVPGASARQTYDAGTGECAAHARLLVAFCRGVGIPARTATGCMYTPIQGGSFGQHVWNEIYVGDEVGWVSVDTAVQEPEYIDSGHIRLGELVSFNPVEMEVLDVEVDGWTAGDEPE